jgi:hypothetical protein
MTKNRLNDDSIRVLRKAIRTKLGISAPKAAKSKPKRETEDDEPAPRKKAERLNYTDI